MNFVRWFFSPRSRNDWKSWNAVFVTAPFALGVVFVLFNSNRDHAIATRQETTTGVVIGYEPSNHNQCSYSFESQGKQYQGRSSSPTRTATIGQQVVVYFDRNDPESNSLEDFESASRSYRGVLLFMILGIIGVIGLILYSKVRST